MEAAVDLTVACVDALWPLASQAPQAWLSPSETRRLERIRGSGRYREFVASRCLMRMLLSAHTGFERGWQSWVLEAPDNASPVVHACGLDGAGLHLNLSHSQGLLACAVFHLPVGVDLEVRRAARLRDVAGLSELVCSEQEQSWLAGLPDEGARQSAFLQLWTRKEAYFKWQGTGLDLSLLPAVCSQTPCPPQSAIAAGSSLAGEWGGRGFDLSVCAGASPVEVRIRLLEGVACLAPAHSSPWALAALSGRA